MACAVLSSRRTLPPTGCRALSRDTRSGSAELHGQRTPGGTTAEGCHGGQVTATYCAILLGRGFLSEEGLAGLHGCWFRGSVSGNGTHLWRGAATRVRLAVDFRLGRCSHCHPYHVWPPLTSGAAVCIGELLEIPFPAMVVEWSHTCAHLPAQPGLK